MIIDILLENGPPANFSEDDFIKQIINRVLVAAQPALEDILNKYKGELANVSAPNPNLWQRVKNWWNKFTNTKHLPIAQRECLELYKLVSPLNEAYGDTNLNLVFKNLTNDIQKVLAKSLYSQLKVIVPKLIQSRPKLVKAVALPDDEINYQGEPVAERKPFKDYSFGKFVRDKSTLPTEPTSEPVKSADPIKEPVSTVVPEVKKGKKGHRPCPECGELNSVRSQACKNCKKQLLKTKVASQEITPVEPPVESPTPEVKPEAKPAKLSSMSEKMSKIKKIKAILAKYANDLTEEEEQLFKDFVTNSYNKVLHKKPINDDEQLAIDLHQAKDVLG